ncbi:MAG: NUDIX hydrolase [Candidatus Veblenbacteria bacterium]|nr:NUDIX hydrolase [Candidatus Veblenbacteria bacterium]MDZ4229954.1 NUDIX hydrolase [Candidatus Veblenbacteria bacterium]
MELQVGVKALIKDDKGHYLFLKRALPYEGDAKPKWDIPGGRIEPGEPILEALAREIKEETGLNIKGEPRILHAQDILRLTDKHIVRLTFEVQVEPGEIKLDTSDPNGTHHNDYAWVPAEGIKDLYHDRYLVPVLERLDITPNSP